ncbi:MAG: D-alanine--D-alanine ligase family protein [Minisyncoccota bacterium]
MQTIVGVLRGGPSREHDVSLKTGAAMLAHLPQERFLTRDIYIDKQGNWYDRGKVTTPERVSRQLDVALIGLHGNYGEDGEVQKILERFGVPYSGSDSFASFLAMHKLMTKVHAQEAGLLTPAFRHIAHEEDSEALAHEVTREFSQPVVVKPVSSGSSVGVSVVGGYAPILSALKELFAAGVPSVLVEEYIRGREATVGVIEGLRGEVLYTPPATEIIPQSDDFFTYEAKYSGGARRACPGNFSRVHAEELQRLARVMHRDLGLRHYSRSDFIVAPKGIYYLETNTLPGLADEALLPKSLASVGVPMPDFLEHLVNLALMR